MRGFFNRIVAIFALVFTSLVVVAPMAQAAAISLSGGTMTATNTNNGTATITYTAPSSGTGSLASLQVCYATATFSGTCSGKSTTALSPTSVSSAGTATATLTGLTLGTTYFYTVNSGSSYLTTASFTETAKATVSTSAASSITTVQGMLNGTVNPNGDTGVGTSLVFCYSTSASISSCSGNTQLAVEGTQTGSSAVNVSAIATYLAPGTTYYYVLQATTSQGVQSVSSSPTSFTTLGPTLTNNSGNVSNITASSATVSPTFNSGGSGTAYANTSIQVCWSTTSPVTSCGGSTASFGTGAYSDGIDHTSGTSLTGLNSGTTYYYALFSSMVYNTSASATATKIFYSATQSFTTGNISLVLNSPTSVTNVTATFNGTINANGNAVSSIRYCYSTSSISSCTGGATIVTASTSSLAANDNTIHDLTTNVTGLTFNKTYYVILCGTVTSITCTTASTFTTQGPTLSTTSATSIGNGTATLNGTINPNGYSTTLQFCYSTSSSISSCNGSTATVNGGSAYTNSASQSVSASVTGLLPGTTYYYILQGTEGAATGYSNTSPISSFTTPGPNLQTSAATNLTQSSATANGSVNTFGVDTTLSICYSTTTLVNCVGGTVLTVQISPNPYNNNSSQAISAALASLGAGKTYYYQIMAVQGSNTYYSNVTSFNTQTPGPLVTYTSNTTQSTSATVTGTIYPGAYTSTAWLCYYTARPGSNFSVSLASPCLSGGVQVAVPGTYSGSTTQTITATVTGLSPSTTYYFYFVGNNAVGTNTSQAVSSVGPPVTWSRTSMPSFTTTALSPVVNPTQVTNITATSAKLYGTVQPNSQTTTVSFCYSTNSAIASCSGATQITLSGTVNGNTVSTVSTLISGLTPNTTYYYILQGAGSLTSVSSALSFTTLAAPGVTTTGATGFTNTAAVLRGTVTSNGSTAAVVFCYSTNSSLASCSGGTVNFVAIAGSPFSGTTANQVVTSQIANLAPGTTYYFQIRGTNAAGTNYSNVSSFHTIGGPFGSISNFYQVSATSPALYVYSALTNTQATLGSNTQTGINALGFNTVDGYLYGLDAHSVLWKIDNTGTFTSLGAVANLPVNSNTGGDFIPGTNLFLVNNGTIGWYVIDVSQPTLSATAFTLTTGSGSQPWTAADVVMMQNGSTFSGYGVNGAYLNIMSFVGAGATSAAESSKNVISGTGGYNFPSGVYGATFCDANGNIYVFSNSSSQLWEIPRAQLSSSGSSVVAYLVTTASPALASPNDGASSPYVISPFDPPLPVNDTYAVLHDTTLTVNSSGSSVLSNDQGGLPFGVNSFTFNGTTVSVANQSVNYAGVGTLTFTDLTNGYFTFVPAAGFIGDATFTYTLIETSSPSTLRTSLGGATATIHVVNDQTISWSPTTALNVSQSPYQPSSATSSGNGAITYSVSAPNTSGCAVDPTTGVLTYASTGSCTVIASAAGTSTYGSASVTVTFTISTAPQTITWNPTQSMITANSPYTPAAGAITSGNGAISYAVQSGFTTTTCSVNASTGVLTFTGTGTCTVVVTAASTSLYSVATQNYVFTISSGTQTVTWGPTTALVATAGSNTFSAATTSGNGAITYVVVDPGTSGCAITSASSPTMTFTGYGNCQVMAIASATTLYAQASNTQTFVISLVAQVVTWSPTTALTMASTSATSTSASDLGSVSITYAVTNAGSSGCTVNASTGALTWTNAGSCVVSASAAATNQYTAGSTSVTFVISLLSQTLTWSTTNTFTVLQSPQSITLATALGGVVPTYAVTTAGAGCAITSSGVLTFNAAGTCVVTATAAANTVYNSGTATMTFTISLATQTVTWSPTTSLYYNQSAWTPNIGAVTTGDGAITYAKTSMTSSTCSVNSSTGALTFTNTGTSVTTCTISATAAATATYSSASVSVTFSFNPMTPVISWSPTTSLVLPKTSSSVTSPAPSSPSSGAYTYASSSPSSGVNCSITTAGALTASFNAGTTSGTCVMTVTQASNGNYLSATLSKTFYFSSVALSAQTVTWASTSGAYTTASPYTLSAATALGGATISYAVTATSGIATCSVSLSGSTPIVTYTGAGTCTITATAAATSTYASATAAQTFTSTLAVQTITWSPTLSINPSQSPLTLPAASALGAPTITYSATGTGGATCSISGSTHILTFSGAGTCTVTVTATDTVSDPNGQYANATLSKIFTSTLLSQTVTWSPLLQLYMSSSSYTPPAATALGGVAVTYSVTGTGCAVNSSTGVLTYTQAGNCVVTASAAANGIYGAATNVQTIVISLVTPAITWVPVSTVTDTSQSPYTPDTLASTTGAGAISYSVTDAGTSGCSVNSSTGVITFTGKGNCTILATAAATSIYAQISTSVTFTINPVSPLVIWNPASTAATASVGTFSPTSASTTGDGAITYSVLTNTNSSCSVDSTTGVLTFTGGGTCTVIATSAATAIYNSASAIVTFTIADAPAATTFGAYSITRTGATVSGSVNSNSATATVVICWTTGSDLANCTSASTVTNATPTPSSILGSDINDEVVSAGLTGLLAGTTYYFQVCATNSIGTTCGSVLSFQTVGAPSVTVTAASSVTGHTATVGGTVNANSASTTVTICYSTDSSMSSCTSGLATVLSRNTTPGTLNGTTTTPVTLNLTGLSPNTTYYYQVKAVNSSGTVYSSVLSFTTPQASQIIYLPIILQAPWSSTISVATTADSGLTVSYSTSTPGCSVDSNGIVSATGALSCDVVISQSGDSNYTAATSATVSVTFQPVNQASVTVTSTSATYPDTLTLTSSGGSGTGSISYTLVSSGSANCSLVNGVVSATGPGTCTVTATKAADTNYNSQTSSTTTITFAAVLSVTTSTATGKTSSSLNLPGVVNANGDPGVGSIQFCYQTTAFTTGNCTGTIVNASPSSASGSSPTSINFSLTSLIAGTVYYYELQATNAIGVTYFGGVKSARTLAVDGSGSVTADKSSVASGASGQTITFTFTPASGGLSGGTIQFVVPSGWSLPSTSSSAAGYITVSGSSTTPTVTIVGRTVTITNVTVDSPSTITIIYGATSGTGTGATAGSIVQSQTWLFSESGSGATPANLASSPSISIVALTATFYPNFGSGSMGAQNFVSGVSQTLTANSFSRTGYTFAGWDTNSNATTVVYTDGQNIAITQNKSLYAVWTPNTYVTTYDPGTGGSVSPSSASFTVGSSALTLPTPANHGFVFAGWFSASSGGVKIGDAGATYSPSQSTTLYAQWNPEVYTVTYEPGAGSVSPTSDSYTYGGSALTLPTPSNSGYTFTGWYTLSSGGTLVALGGANYSPTQSLTVYAHWSANTSHITYDPTGGSVSPTSQNFVSGSTAISLPAPSRPGYSFAGWYDGSSLVGGAGDPFSTLTDVNLSASWTANTYTVTYNPGSGASVSPTSTTYTSGTTALVLPTPTKYGYTFKGWYTLSSGGSKLGNAGAHFTTTNDVTLYGQWTINTHTITYAFGSATSGSAPSDGSSPYNFNSLITLLGQGSLDRQGYSFAGWNTKSDGTGTSYSPGDTFTLGDSDVTLYPTWTANPDGLGSVSVSPATVVATSAGNTLYFTFTAGLSAYNGTVTFTVPSGFSAPSTANRVGFVTSSIGSVSILGRVITISGVSLDAGGQFLLTYGSTTNGGLGAVAPANIGATVWTVQEESLDSGTLTPIQDSPIVTVVNAADGSGTAAIVPDHVIASSTGNTITLTYTATIGGLTNGALTFMMPAGWSAPSLNSSDPGYVSVSGSSSTVVISVSGQVITVSNVTLATFATLTLVYGASSGAVVSSVTGAAQFPVSEQSTADGSLIPLVIVPSLVVLASNDGTGTLTASPSSVLQNSSGNVITLTYTAAAAMTQGKLQFSIPAGWSAPSLTGVAAGFITASTGTLSVSGRVVTITGVTLASGDSVTIVFGNRLVGAGPGATSPAIVGSTTWWMSQAATSAGILTQLQSAPVIFTTAGKPVFTSTYKPTFTFGIGGSQNVTAIGGGNLPPTITASFNGSSILPIGVSFTSSANTGAGVITISPTTALGSYSILFTASNTGGTNTQLFKFEVVNTGEPTAIYATTDYAPQTVDLTWTAPVGINVDSYTITSFDLSANTAGPTQENLTTTSTVFSQLIGGDTYQFTVTAFFNLGDSASALSNFVLPVTVSPAAPVAQGAPSYSQSGTSQATQGTAGQINSITAVATGQGSVAVGTYTNTNPTMQSGFSIPNGSTSYDVRVSPGSSFSVVSFVICGVVGNKIYWFDSIHKTQVLVNPAPIPVVGQPGCATVNLSNSSTPAINDGTLYGSIFYTPAADGTGSMVISPPTSVAGSRSNTLTFTYTAANDLSNGAVSFTVPQGWTAPTTTPGTAGYVTASKGTISVSGSVITVSGLSMASHTNLVIVYGSTANSAPGVTTPLSAQTWSWSAQERSTQYGSLLGLATSPTNRTTGTTLAATSVSSSVSNNTIVVAWTAPTIPSGSPLFVANYVVTASPSGAVCTVSVGTNRCVFPNVLNNVIYSFTVKVNGNGPSAVSNSVTPRALGGSSTVALAGVFSGNDTALPSSFTTAILNLALSIVANHYTNVKIIGSSFNGTSTLVPLLGTNRALNIKRLLLQDLIAVGSTTSVVISTETFGPTVAAANNSTTAGQTLNQRNIVILS